MKGNAPSRIVQLFRGAERSSHYKFYTAEGKYLDITDIMNTAKIWTQEHPDKRQSGNDEAWSEQISEARHFLEGEGYMTRIHEAYKPATKKEPEGMAHALSFGHPKRLRILRASGYLSLMDATHDMNSLRWYLFTIMVRDGCNMWHPCAHMLCDSQNSNIISQFLRTVKRWCQWMPRFFLTDDSAAELLAVKKAFPGLKEGEQEVTHFLCRVHSMRTLNRKLKKEPVALKHLLKALKYRKSLPGCDQELELAMNGTRSDKTKKYI